MLETIKIAYQKKVRHVMVDLGGARRRMVMVEYKESRTWFRSVYQQSHMMICNISVHHLSALGGCFSDLLSHGPLVRTVVVTASPCTSTFVKSRWRRWWPTMVHNKNWGGFCLMNSSPLLTTMETGPNDARRIVWALDVYFHFLSLYI